MKSCTVGCVTLCSFFGTGVLNQSLVVSRASSFILVLLPLKLHASSPGAVGEDGGCGQQTSSCCTCPPQSHKQCQPPDLNSGYF